MAHRQVDQVVTVQVVTAVDAMAIQDVTQAQLATALAAMDRKPMVLVVMVAQELADRVPVDRVLAAQVASVVLAVDLVVQAVQDLVVQAQAVSATPTPKP